MYVLGDTHLPFERQLLERRSLGCFKRDRAPMAQLETPHLPPTAPALYSRVNSSITSGVFSKKGGDKPEDMKGNDPTQSLSLVQHPVTEVIFQSGYTAALVFTGRFTSLHFSGLACTYSMTQLKPSRLWVRKVETDLKLKKIITGKVTIIQYFCIF